MSLSNSPSLQEYQGGIPKQRPDHPFRRKILRMILALLLLALLGLAITLAIRSDTAALLAGKGGLTGKVIDERGAPLIAQIYVFGVDKRVDADEDGSFTYMNIPAGQRNLIIAFNGTAQEFSVTVEAGQTVDLGTLTFFVSTPTIEP